MSESQESTVDSDRTSTDAIGGHVIDRTPRVKKIKPLSAWWMFLLAFAVAVADQWFKWWIRARIEPGDTIEFWPGVMHWSHVWNYGAAWGVFAGARWPLIIASALVIAGIVFSAKRIAGSGRPAVWAAGLILGGAIGNLIDRLQFGYVLDMIDLDTPVKFLREFPVFNLADSALTGGVLLLLVLSFLPPKKTESTVETDRSADAPNDIASTQSS
ncbi:MAG TPA: signal peptidase II [Abditibacteriaceae bacterium]|jgi:signal peptidase II